ncbi:MAG: hypothetical protein IJK18_03040 [Clostridia bacterium]|nr:hypothetical protein [Clostridia bacterium]
MNKILVKVYVPIIEEQYDILIPLNRRIYNVIKLLVKAINELSNGYYEPQNEPMLYDKITAIPYDGNLSIKESNIRNGTELILL